MNRMKAFVLAVLCALVVTKTFSQDIPVDLFTGTPGISVPIWTLQDHDLTVPVMLGYNASGLKLEEGAHFIGVGWNIVGGNYCVSREVRSLPDDFDGIAEAKVDVGGTITNYDNRRGWLHPRKYQTTVLAKEVGDYSFGSDNSSTSCTDEYDDNNKLNAWFGVSDTEPDMFYVSAPGLSAAFVFDNSATPQIRLLSLQDLKIEYVIHETSKALMSFKITDNNGVVYDFTSPTVVDEMTSFPAGVVSTDFFSNQFMQYYNHATSYPGTVKYHSQWMLTKITSPSGANITFNYTPRFFSFTKPIRVGIANVAGNGVDVATMFNVTKSTNHQILNSITSSAGEKVTFNYTSGPNELIRSIEISDARRASPFVKEFTFNHQGASYRPFLLSLTERSYCDELPPYIFSYIGVDPVTGNSELPLPSSFSKDFWGYYNGAGNTVGYPTLYVYPSLPYPHKVRLTSVAGLYAEEIILLGANRFPSIANMKIGSLNMIQYQSGGTLTITYQANTYINPYSNSTSIGGGLRVSQLKFTDGMGSSANDIIKDFTYEQSNGMTSGYLLNHPVFYLPSAQYESMDGSTITPYSTLAAGTPANLWNRLLVRTEESVTPQENFNGIEVAFKNVTVSRPGAGSVKYTYSLPATYGVTSSYPWVPTQNKFARSACYIMGIADEGGPWRFPHSRNPSYELERGLLQTVEEFNESGVKVRETTYNYQTLHKSNNEPFKVWAVSFDKFPRYPNVFNFGRYSVSTESAKVLSQEQVKMYSSGSVALTSTVNYYYESTAHRYMTRKVLTNSDGTVHTTRVKYAQDYMPPVAGADTQSQMIGYMQTNGLTGIPVETIRKIQKPSETEKVLGASLTMFAPATAGRPRLEKTLVFSTEAPVSDFTESSIASGTTFLKDNRYEVTGVVNAYDTQYDLPVTIEDPVSRTKVSTVYGYNKTIPIAQVTDASLTEVAFSDFETTTDVELAKSGSVYGKGRSGNNAIHPSVTLSRSITKAATGTYILSFWANTGSGSLTINAAVKYGATTTTTPIAIATTGNKFKYIEKKIDVSAAPSSFTIELTSDVPAGTYTSSATLLPVIDDVAFYPDFSVMSSSAYDVPYGVTSAAANGKTSYTSYDHLGRVKYVYDQEMNLVGRNTYAYKAVTDKLTAEFTMPPLQNGVSWEYLYNTPAKFVAWEDCHEGVTYEWDMGTGTFVAGTREQTYTFTTYGTYSIRLRVSKPGYATVTVTKQLPIPSSFTICAKGTEKFEALTGKVKTTFAGTCSTTATPSDWQTVFHAVNGSDIGATTFNWKIRNIGSDTWLDASSLKGPEYVNTRPAFQPVAAFEVMCEAPTAAGVFYSNVIKVLAE